ncbi:MAG: poly-gamma-glutamate biosynthesis protein PgsC [Candidatus Aminicenantes bacterium]
MIYETFFIGLLLAVIYIEIFDIYPGGLIVPAYIALYLHLPVKVAATLLVAFLALFSYKFFSRHLILFGKRRFAFLVILGAFWAQLWFLIWPELFPYPVGVRAVGLVIPGLLANNLERQRYIPTLASLFTVSVLTYFVVRILVWLGM